MGMYSPHVEASRGIGYVTSSRSVRRVAGPTVKPQLLYLPTWLIAPALTQDPLQVREGTRGWRGNTQRLTEVHHGSGAVC